MTLPDRILELLRDGPLDDNQLADRLGARRPHVNSTCRRLADRELVLREPGPDGKLANRLTDKGQDWADRSPIDPPEGEPWYWEGNVQRAVRDQLVAEGWAVLQEADTAAGEQGVDLFLERNGQRLAVEVKGYPKSTYQRGPKRGQPKPTPPTLQAGHWFNDAFMKLVRLRGRMPDVELAMALPNFPRYRTLVQETGWALKRLGFQVLVATDEGDVRKVGV